MDASTVSTSYPKPPTFEELKDTMRKFADAAEATTTAAERFAQTLRDAALPRAMNFQFLHAKPSSDPLDFRMIRTRYGCDVIRPQGFVLTTCDFADLENRVFTFAAYKLRAVRRMDRRRVLRIVRQANRKP